MQSETPEPRNRDPLPPRTLEFRQAMKDFRTMFPTIDRDLIECVLRSNSGHVDSTINQLLQLSQDQERHRPTMRPSQFAPLDDSTDTDDSIPSELLSPPTSSDDDVVVRDPPPMYTPRAGDSCNFFESNNPVEVPFGSGKKRSQKIRNDSNAKSSGKSYKAWNPPMLGTLPEDFLRILPQQFVDVSVKDKRKKKSSSSSRRQAHTDQNSDARGAKPSYQSQANNDRKLQAGRMGNTMANSYQSDPPRLRPQQIDVERNPGPVPPPRPSRTIDSRSRRIPQPIVRDQMASNNIEQGNLFIQPAVFPSNNVTHRNGGDFHPMSNPRTRHSQRSSRTSHSRTTTHPCVHQSTPNSLANGNLHRRHSDFASRRMVMVPRPAEPTTTHHENMSLNGVHPVHTEERDFALHPQLSRSTSHSRNHCQSTSVPTSVNRARKRTQHEEEQYVEDCRLAILLQNEEFISELKRNEEFLKALEKDRSKDTNVSEKSIHRQSSKEFNSTEIVPLPDPDAKYTHGSRTGNTLKQVSPDDLEKEDEKAFNENLKHMGKSARKKFNEIARKFSVRRKYNYKSIQNIDPVFANCDDEIEEMRGRQSPVFELNGR